MTEDPTKEEKKQEQQPEKVVAEPTSPEEPKTEEKAQEQKATEDKTPSKEPEVDSTIVEEKTIVEDKDGKIEEVVEKEVVVKAETKPKAKAESKPKAKAKPKQKKDKKDSADDEPDDDFNYIVRIANTDIDGNLKAIYGIMQIKGVGRHLATLIAHHSKLNRNKKMGLLTPEELDTIQETLDAVTDIAPSWMLNHRKDIDTGEDIHLLSDEIDLDLRDQLNMLRMIRCYRGMRHELRLPARGQRTRSNNRHGLTLGVSKKR